MEKITSSCFTKEHNLIIDSLSRRIEGALLISGKRGVGKTSAVLPPLLAILAIEQLRSLNKSPEPYPHRYLVVNRSYLEIKCHKFIVNRPNDFYDIKYNGKIGQIRRKYVTMNSLI